MVCAMATHNNEPFIGSAEVCRLLRINQATVGRWVEAKKLVPVHKLPGKNGAYLFDRAAIERLDAKLAAERAEQSA